MTILQAKTGWHFALILVCILALAITGCPKPDDANIGKVEPAPHPDRDPIVEQTQHSGTVSLNEEVDRATFIFTSDFQGFQRPCGCAAAQHGGLLRLASINQIVGSALGSEDTSSLSNYSVTLPESLSGQHLLWQVDCGNFADSTRRFPGLRVEAHLASLDQAGAVAAVINQNELMLSEQDALVGFADAPLPLVCCNVSANIPGVSFENSIQLAQNWYLIGVAANAKSNPAEGQGGWWEYNDPLQSVVQALSELPEGVNVVVAAAHQPAGVISELRKLDVSVVIGGETGRLNQTEGLAPRFGTPGGRARKLQLLSFDTGYETGLVPWFIVVGEEWPDDKGVWETLKAFQFELKDQATAEMAAQYGLGGFENIAWGMDDKYLPPSDQPKITFEGLHYVGSNQCLECHQAEYRTWSKSKHTSAWKSIVEVNEQNSLDCLQCHTTGMLEPGGYLPFAHDDNLVSVGCESCHGPGSEHLEWAKDGAGEFDGSTESRITLSTMDDCIICHDSYNSPDFEAETYWNHIAH